MKEDALKKWHEFREKAIKEITGEITPLVQSLFLRVERGNLSTAEFYQASSDILLDRIVTRYANAVSTSSDSGFIDLLVREILRCHPLNEKYCVKVFESFAHNQAATYEMVCALSAYHEQAKKDYPFWSQGKALTEKIVQDYKSSGQVPAPSLLMLQYRQLCQHITLPDYLTDLRREMGLLEELCLVATSPPVKCN